MQPAFTKESLSTLDYLCSQMGANRPYRDGRAMDIIIAELKRCSGTQFDPRVVEAFLKAEGN